MLVGLGWWGGFGFFNFLGYFQGGGWAGGLGWWPRGGGLGRCVGHVGWAGVRGWLVRLEVRAGRLGCWLGPMGRAGEAWLVACFFLLRG